MLSSLVVFFFLVGGGGGISLTGGVALANIGGRVVGAFVFVGDIKLISSLLLAGAGALCVATERVADVVGNGSLLLLVGQLLETSFRAAAEVVG
jgi:hypothetical protein